MAQPAVNTERKALVDLMNEVVALNQRTPNRNKKIDEAFMAIYYHIDKQLEAI